MTIVEFLMARIEEDEEVARAAAAEQVGWAIGEPDATGERRLWDYLPVVSTSNPESIEPVVAEHVARWSPQRILEEAHAKRQVLALHSMASGVAKASPTKAAHFAGVESGVEAAINLLAQPYSTHPDFRDEWRPRSERSTGA